MSETVYFVATRAGPVVMHDADRAEEFSNDGYRVTALTGGQ